MVSKRVLIALVGAASATVMRFVPPEFEEMSAKLPPALPGTRHIMMATDDTFTKCVVKYVNVPDGYDMQDVAHAEFVGWIEIFENGEVWLMMDDKRLFLYPDYAVEHLARSEAGVGMPEDWPLMSPEELKEALKEAEPFEEIMAEFQASQARRKAAIEEAEMRGEVVDDEMAVEL